MEIQKRFEKIERNGMKLTSENRNREKLTRKEIYNYYVHIEH